jgi:protein required for attachment to host cells
MPLPHNALVLVIDGGKQLFLRNHGDGQQIDLRVEAHDEQAIGKDGDLKSDAPGVSVQSGGYGRSTMEEPDYHQQAEDRWVAEAAETLKTRALNNDFDALAIVVPPKALGVLRPLLHKEVRKRIVLELAKDLANQPIPAIEKALAGASAVELPA